MGITNSNKTISVDRIECDGTLRVTLCAHRRAGYCNQSDGYRARAGPFRQYDRHAADQYEGRRRHVHRYHRRSDRRHGRRSDRFRQPYRNRQLFEHCDGRYAANHFGRHTEKTLSIRWTAGGSTNHGDAFTKAIELFDAASTNHKVIVMFTDGNTTTGVPPAPIAAAARARGITIYCIGLVGSDGVDVSALNTWATPPAASHGRSRPTRPSWKRCLRSWPPTSPRPARRISLSMRSSIRTL